MLEMIPKSPFSNCFSFRGPDHALVQLDVSQWREVAEFQLKQDKYALYREGDWKGALALRGDFVLAQNGEVIARAQKVSVFRSTFRVTAGNRELMLEKRSFIGRTFVVLEKGREVGAIRRVSFWSRRTSVELPLGWPAALQVYLFWLVLMMWNREESSA